MDGGLCSQMFEYTIGELLKANGFDVKFDLSWFENCGRDVLGKDARFFEIKKLYPKLLIKKASPLCIFRFKSEYRCNGDDFESIMAEKRNIYFLNDVPRKYPREKLAEIAKKVFCNPIAPRDKANVLVAEEIVNDPYSCAVHVRRGDLANPDIAMKSGYGKCVSEDYYKNAVSIMKSLVPNARFYFFSDDLPFVKEKLLPLFGEIKYRIVDENISTVLNGGGYKDFYLITLCRHQICSLGSFGIEAAKLNKNKNKIVISPPRDTLVCLDNYIVLDESGNKIESKNL